MPIIQLVPVEELSSVLAIFGMTLPLAALGPPLYNMIYKVITIKHGFSRYFKIP